MSISTQSPKPYVIPHLDKVNCSGERMIFEVVQGTNYLAHHVINERVMPNKNNNNVAFIECHQFNNSSIKKLCQNMIVAVGTKSNKGKELTWRLGIVASLAVRTHPTDDPEEQYDGMLAVYIWSGECCTNKDGSVYPALFHEDTRGDAMKHLTLEHIEFKKRSGLTIKALNQFNGVLPSDKDDYAIGIINEEDECVQCSYDGPDRYGIILPRARLPISLGTNDNSVPTDIPSTYSKNTKESKRLRMNSVRYASIHDEEDIAFINRAPNFITTQNEATAVVVTDSQNKPLSLKDVSSIEKKWDGLFFAPSLTDCVNEFTLQKVFALTLDQTEVLKAMNGVDPLKVETILKDNSVACIHTICVNTNQELPSYSQVFAGKSSPPILGSFVEKKLPRLNRIVHYAVVQTKDIDKYTPLHTALVDKDSHHHKLNYQEVNVVKNGLSSSGSYPQRLIKKTTDAKSVSSQKGHNSYHGRKTDTSRCRPTPGEGPGMKAKFNLHRRNSTNVLYLPGVIHILNALANQIFRVPSILYRALSCLLICSNPGYGFNSYCRIAILTINFYNKSHIDRGDAFSEEESKLYLDKAKHIRDSPLTVPSEQEHMDGFIKFIEDFGVSVPTTCGIQYVRTAEGLANPESNIFVCQVFLMLGLGLSLRMCNYMTHVFMGRVFQHCTCMPIILVDGLAYFGSHPYIDIVNWGASGSGNITDREREVMAARERQNRERRAIREREARVRSRY